METKKPWQSKTILLNAILGIASVLVVFMPGAEVVPQFITAHAGEIGAAWAVLGIILRLITKDKIQLGE